MSDKIDVLGIRLDDCLAKDAIKTIMQYIKEETVSMVEVVTAETVMRMVRDGTESSRFCEMDLVLPGDKAVLETAEITDEKLLQEVYGKDFIRMLFQYLHKNAIGIFLLADTEEEVRGLETYFQKKYKHIKIKGMATVPEGIESDDMIINEINGTEAECIIANVVSGRQEAFICRCKNVLNVNLWVGISQTASFYDEGDSLVQRFKGIINKRILKRKAILEKKRRNA